jgi:acyl carrier protein
MSIEPVEKVFREVFNTPSIALYPEMTAKDLPGWDSFRHVTLIVALEEALGVEFSPEEMASAPNVGALIDMLKGKGVDLSW